MQTNIITWSTIHHFGSLWFEHLEVRKRLFIDVHGWNVPHNDRAEWDQYDTAATAYIITHRSGRVLASSRLLRCDHDSGGWSYMIRDAAKGRLQGIPANLIQAPPTSSDTWEATRFAADPVLPADLRNAALSENARQLIRYAEQQGASSILALMPPAFVRWLRQAGLETKRAGPIVQTGDGQRACVIASSLQPAYS